MVSSTYVALAIVFANLIEPLMEYLRVKAKPKTQTLETLNFLCEHIVHSSIV